MQKATEHLKNVLMETGAPDERTHFEAVEVIQDYCDYLEALADDLPPVDLSVTVKIDGEKKGLRFPDVDHFAAFLAERMNA